VVQNASNLGPVLNWKAGVQEAKGEWVKILFSDDMLEPTYLEETIKRTSSPDVGAVLVRFSDAFRFGRSSWSTEEFLARSFLPGKKVSCSPSAFLLKREAVLEALSLRFETPAPKPLLSTGVGYDFACVVTSVLTGRRVELVDSILVHYRAHPDNLTSSLGSLRTATLLYCDAYHEIIRYCRLPEFLKVCFHGCLVIRKIYYGFRLK
jgi:hypothetical protein